MKGLYRALFVAAFGITAGAAPFQGPSVEDVLTFQPTAENLLPNGSFSMGLTAEPFYPGWRPTSRNLEDMVPAPDESPALPLLVDDGAQTNCLKMSLNSEAQTGILFVKLPDLDPSQSYTLSFRARASRSGILLDPLINRGGPHFNVGPDLSLGTDWQNYSITINSNHTKGYASPSFRFETKASGGGAYQVYLDDFVLINDAWGSSGSTLPAVGAALVPGSRNGAFLHGSAVPLNWRVQGTCTNDVSVGLYLRDISRNGTFVTQDLGTLNLSDGEVHGDEHLLNGLKRGHYQALIAVVDADTRELLAVGREIFSVLSDLNGLNAPTFAVGSDRAFTTAGGRHEFNWRGFWNAQEFYQQNAQNGIRFQRIYYRLNTLAPREDVYNWYLDRHIEYAWSNGCTTALVFPQVPYEMKKTEYAEVMAADPADGDGIWWMQESRLLLEEERSGKQSWESYLETHEVLMPDTNFLAAAAVQCSQRYAGKVDFIELMNESNGTAAPEVMVEVARAIAPAFRTNSPATKIFLNTTSDIDGSDPQVESYSTEFFDAGGTNWSDGYSFHAYGSPGIMPSGFDLTDPVGEGDATGVERMAVYRDRAANYGLEFGQSEVFHFYSSEAPKDKTGWHYLQRVLLDVSYGALYSGSEFPMHLYALETGTRSTFHNAGTGAPGTVCVALNGLHRVLEGGTALGVIDKHEELLIGTFQTQRSGTGTRYAAALVAGENTRIAELTFNTNEIPDLKAYDMWGEEIPVPVFNGRLYVGREAFYLESTSSTALFEQLQAASLNWMPGCGYRYTDLSYGADEQEAAAVRSGLHIHVDRFADGTYTVSRVAEVSSDYVSDLTQLSLSGDPVEPTAAGAYLLDHAALPGSGTYTKMALLAASNNDVENYLVKMSSTDCGEATLFVNGVQVFSGSASDLYYLENWMEGTCAIPTGRSLIELIVKPSGPVSQIRLEAETVELGPDWLSGTSVFSAADDAHVQVGNPDKNAGTDSSLVLKGTAGFNRSVFMKFDLRDSVGEITGAQLFLHSQDCNVPVKIRSVNNSWSEMDITWNNAPFGSADETVLDTATAIPGEWFSLDLSDTVSQAGIYSFLIEIASDSDSSVYKLDSSESSFPPRLELEVFVDLDSDQLPDGWEWDHFGGPFVSDGEATDSDEDGSDDLHEYHAGTGPLDPGSIFKITGFAHEPSERIQVQWNSVTGKSYRVMSSTNLMSESWMELTNGISGTGGVLSYEFEAEGEAALFVRPELDVTE